MRHQKTSTIATDRRINAKSGDLVIIDEKPDKPNPIAVEMAAERIAEPKAKKKTAKKQKKAKKGK